MSRPQLVHATCAEFADLLSEYLDDELGPLDRVRVSMHLASCTRCAQEARALAEVVRAIHRVGRPPARPASR